MPDSQALADLNSRRQLGFPQWRRCSSFNDHRILLGGRITWLYAAHNPQLKAAVAWYGKLTGDKSLNSPKQPVDIATDLNVPASG